MKSGRGKYLSADSTAVHRPGDNVERSMQTSEKLLNSEPGQVGKEVKRKKRTFPLTKHSKHRSNATVSFDCSGVPFPGDNIDTSLQFSKIVPSEREVNHSNQKLSRRARRRWNAKSRVSMRQDDHAVPVRVAQHSFTSLDYNLKTSFPSTSSPNKGLSSVSFEAAESCEFSLPEKVDSALDIQKGTMTRHSRRSRKRLKGNYCLTNVAFDDSRNVCILPRVKLDTPNCSAESCELPLPEKVDSALDIQKSTKIKHSRRCRKRWKGNYCLANTAYGSKHVCILPRVKLDTPNCSDIGTQGKEINMARNQNIQCLKNEVHENHSADTASLPNSIIHKVTRALRSPFRKKLLVLDLNGILCDVVFGSHGSCLPYKRVSMRSVFKRPFLDNFLAFCFERFAVGIWSSRNKNNNIGVINYVMGDSKDRLLFCWDQSKCTFTGFNTIENRHKPLVLKELIKLWDKEEASLPWEKGEYSPTNTLLVDDSPYKALCNPPHTAIFPFSYAFQDEGDNVLGPGGAIRVYLESIAMADDVQEYVKKHSFGQEAITSKDQMWGFYKNIIDKNNSMT